MLENELKRYEKYRKELLKIIEGILNSKEDENFKLAYQLLSLDNLYFAKCFAEVYNTPLLGSLVIRPENYKELRILEGSISGYITITDTEIALKSEQEYFVKDFFTQCSDERKYSGFETDDTAPNVVMRFGCNYDPELLKRIKVILFEDLSILITTASRMQLKQLPHLKIIGYVYLYDILTFFKNTKDYSNANFRYNTCSS